MISGFLALTNFIDEIFREKVPAGIIFKNKVLLYCFHIISRISPRVGSFKESLLNLIFTG